MMSLDDAEAEFTGLCKEIGRLEKRLRAARTRAEKLAHYIEIAREKESARTAEAARTVSGQSTVARTVSGQPTVVKLRRRRRTQE